MVHLCVESIARILRFVKVILVLLLTLAVELDVVLHVHCVETSLLHLLDMLNVLLMHELFPRGLLICKPLQLSLFKGQSGLPILVHILVSLSAQITRLGLKFTSGFVLVFADLVCFLLLQLHLVYFFELGFEGLVRADVSVLLVDVVLVAEVVV